MPHDLSSLEADLRSFRPAALDQAMLARLDACAANTWSQPTPAEIHFEQQLLGRAPAPLPPDLLASLEISLRNVPFPGREKVIRFPHPNPHPAQHRRAWWSVAAAVALTGAVTALLVPSHRAPDKLATIPESTHLNLPANTAAHLVPAGFNRGLTEARDEGVVWQANNQPQRVVKVVYMDRVTLKDANNRTIQVEQPRVEYILVPAKAD